jgi:hypothetical protein
MRYTVILEVSSFRSVLEELKKQFALCRYVELGIDPPPMILDGTGRDPETFRDGRGGMAGENERRKLPLPRA